MRRPVSQALGAKLWLRRFTPRVTRGLGGHTGDQAGAGWGGSRGPVGARGEGLWPDRAGRGGTGLEPGCPDISST